MSDCNATRWTLHQASCCLQQGEISSQELTQECLNAIAQHNSQLNCFVAQADKAALAAAKQADERRARGKALGPLDGIPVALKDMILTTELPTTACSGILRGYQSPYDATVWRKLREQGAVLLGKLNQDEFAMGSSTETSAYGPCRNPWDLNRCAGGSSGGSAAAVSAGLCLGSLGTDTGGSVRQPAAFCGIVGLRPTYGRVSRFGVVAFASSLDQVGPMAADVPGCALLLDAIAGHDANDSTSLPNPAGGYAQQLQKDISGLQVGVAKQLLEQADDCVRKVIEQAIASLRSRGAHIQEVVLPDADLCVAVYYVLTSAEASSNLSRYDGIRYGPRLGEDEGLQGLYTRTRGELFGDEVKRRILLGTYVLSAGYYDAYYVRAQQVRRLLAQQFSKVLQQVDVIVTPTTPSPAFMLGEKIRDPLSMYLNDVCTAGVSLAGVPALSLNAGFCSKGLPVGVQLIGKPLAELTLLQTGHALQQQLALDNHPPLLKN
ncbi:MAG: Asp-tRNA(Asn)/Glu-tRNA(Gln) amidotransferase subunit GatA [Myxococcota bacterium]